MKHGDASLITLTAKLAEIIRKHPKVAVDLAECIEICSALQNNPPVIIHPRMVASRKYRIAHDYLYEILDGRKSPTGRISKHSYLALVEWIAKQPSFLQNSMREFVGSAFIYREQLAIRFFMSKGLISRRSKLHTPVPDFSAKAKEAWQDTMKLHFEVNP